MTNGVSADDIRDGLEVHIPSIATEMQISIDDTLRGSSVVIFPRGSVERRWRRSFWRGWFAACLTIVAMSWLFIGLDWLKGVLR